MVELAQRFGEPESVPGTSVNWVFQLFDRPSKIRGPEKLPILEVDQTMQIYGNLDPKWGSLF